VEGEDLQVETMHTTKVEMKDGEVLYGVLWDFRPEEGWMKLVGCEDNGPDEVPGDRVLYFRDMKSAVTLGQRVALNKIEDQDEIARAKEFGWDGT